MNICMWIGACVSHFCTEKCCLYSRRHHLPKNKEVKVCEILVMLPFVIYLTSHIYSFPEILASDESLLKWSLQMITPRLVCWILIAKILNKSIKTWKKWSRCWSQKLAASFLSQTKMFLRLPVRQTNVFLSGTGEQNDQPVLAVYQLGTFSDRGSWIHHDLQGL